METDNKNSIEYVGKEATGSAKVKLMRAERYKTIAMQLEQFSTDKVKGLCLALLVPLTDKQIDDLFNQLENIGVESENKND